MTRISFSAFEKQRSDCFKLLAVCFYPPEREMLIEEEVVENLHRSLQTVCPEAAPYAESMAKELSQAADDGIAVAHARLFVGPFELKAPPYGSVYLEPQKILMGDSTIGVLEIYQSAGLTLSEDFKDAPDHIVVKLEFMHFLITKEIQALHRGDTGEAIEYLKMQHEFFDEYLSSWLELFCEKIRLASEHDFYTRLADCLSTFILKTPVPGALPADTKEEE